MADPASSGTPEKMDKEGGTCRGDVNDVDNVKKRKEFDRKLKDFEDKGSELLMGNNNNNNKRSFQAVPNA